LPPSRALPWSGDRLVSWFRWFTLAKPRSTTGLFLSSLRIDLIGRPPYTPPNQPFSRVRRAHLQHVGCSTHPLFIVMPRSPRRRRGAEFQIRSNPVRHCARNLRSTCFNKMKDPPKDSKKSKDNSTPPLRS
jgi:hypothetical protein